MPRTLNLLEILRAIGKAARIAKAYERGRLDIDEVSRHLRGAAPGQDVAPSLDEAAAAA